MLKLDRASWSLTKWENKESEEYIGRRKNSKYTWTTMKTSSAKVVLSSSLVEVEVEDWFEVEIEVGVEVG